MPFEEKTLTASFGGVFKTWIANNRKRGPQYPGGFEYMTDKEFADSQAGQIKAVEDQIKTEQDEAAKKAKREADIKELAKKTGMTEAQIKDIVSR